MADISGWSNQQIIDFLLKYPTIIKANFAGADVTDTYLRAACSATGQYFLPIHAENRKKAGDITEYNMIMKVVQSCQVMPTPAPVAVSVQQPTAPPITYTNVVTAPTGATAAAVMPSMQPGPIGQNIPPAVYNITETPQDYSGLMPQSIAPTPGVLDWKTVLLIGGALFLLRRLL